MKVVLAATPEQEEHIGELIQHLVTNVLPYYITDEEIESYPLFFFPELHNDLEKMFPLYNGTIKDALAIISSLQTIIILLETVQTEPIEHKHREIFTKNVVLLKEYGFTFPFSMDQFSQEERKQVFFSRYAKATNEYLV
ncbi:MULTISPECIES: DUF5365 family protein [Bacillus]|uniref:DUF5365 family protein n=1 Tax=Bacillus TaxID=1386 RepID=UPI000BB8145F|nr:MULTISPECIES: DUF5365 family protein [Bacillus]